MQLLPVVRQQQQPARVLVEAPDGGEQRLAAREARRQQLIDRGVDDALVVGRGDDVAGRLVEHDGQRRRRVERLAVEAHVGGARLVADAQRRARGRERRAPALDERGALAAVAVAEVGEEALDAHGAAGGRGGGVGVCGGSGGGGRAVVVGVVFICVASRRRCSCAAHGAICPGVRPCRHKQTCRRRWPLVAARRAGENAAARSTCRRRRCSSSGGAQRCRRRRQSCRRRCCRGTSRQ